MDSVTYSATVRGYVEEGGVVRVYTHSLSRFPSAEGTLARVLDELDLDTCRRIEISIVAVPQLSPRLKIDDVGRVLADG